MRTVIRLALAAVVWLALSPVVVRAAPPAPEGQEVFSDDFSDPGKSGLEDNRNAQDFERGFHDPGVYHLRLLNTNDERWTTLPDQSYGDFTMEVELWDNSDEFAGSAALGVVFRAQDDSHLYAVLIDARKGEYTIRKLDGADNWTDLVAWTASPLIKQQAEHNMLRVDAQGNTFTVYVNDETLDSVTDDAYAQGSIGFAAMNVDAVQPHMHFDNVVVYSGGETAPPASGPPATEQATGGQAPATGGQPASGQPGALPNTGAAPAPVVWTLGFFALLVAFLGGALRRSANLSDRV